MAFLGDFPYESHDKSYILVGELLKSELCLRLGLREAPGAVAFPPWALQQKVPSVYGVFALRIGDVGPLRSVLERWRKVGKIGKVVHEFLDFSVVFRDYPSCCLVGG